MSRPGFFVFGGWFFLPFNDIFIAFEGDGSDIGWISGGRLEGIGWTMEGRRVNEAKTKDGRRKTGLWAKEEGGNRGIME